MTTGELAVLESRVNARISTAATSGNVASPSRGANASGPDPIVALNISSHKYHCPSCRYALQRTKNGIDIRRSEAFRPSGVPCDGCGGSSY